MWCSSRGFNLRSLRCAARGVARAAPPTHPLTSLRRAVRLGGAGRVARMRTNHLVAVRALAPLARSRFPQPGPYCLPAAAPRRDYPHVTPRSLVLTRPTAGRFGSESANPQMHEEFATLERRVADLSRHPPLSCREWHFTLCYATLYHTAAESLKLFATLKSGVAC